MKDKNYTVILIDEEKALDKIQHPFKKQKQKQKPPESRHRRNIPQHNKSHIRQTHSRHYPQWQKSESIFSKIRNKKRVPTLTITLQHSFGRLSQSNHRRQKINKRNPDWKRISKISLFADNMILYIENPKDTTGKLLELINDYSQVAGYKINTHKSLAFLYTNSEKEERDIKEAISFTIAMKRRRYLEINLPKETKDIYMENYKTLTKENKDVTNRWRNIPSLWIGRTNIVKMSMLPKAIYGFNAIPIKL